jgi:DNA mismatch endonuclease, patch repair protein
MPDNLTPQQRSYCMSRIRGRDTAPEKTIRSELLKRGLKFQMYVKALPGRPDIIFRGQRLAIFIDGDFWHGFRFPLWQHRVSDFWKNKIEKNRTRDQRNFRKLRRMDWTVLRLWQHRIEDDPAECVMRILNALSQRKTREVA